jgi:hypothetical protein
MRYDLLNWLVRQQLARKSIWLVLAIIFSSTAYAFDTCPDPGRIKLDSDGHFVAPHGWRSTLSYSNPQNPKLDFSAAVYEKQDSGESHFEVCRYNMSGFVVNMVPLVITPALGLGSNWLYHDPMDGYYCQSADVADCKFIIGTTKDTTISPFDEIHK